MLVVEDVHWADEATLDVLRYLGRRIGDLPAVLLITYRDDEIGPRPSAAAGAGWVERASPCTGGRCRRCRERRSTSLAGGTSATSAGLYRLTGGNPFFVSEVLAAPDATVPATVVDAVLARVRRLAPQRSRRLEQLAVVPSRVRAAVGARAAGRPDRAQRGRATRDRGGTRRPRSRFRHELARRAVEGSLPATERMRLNARVLAALLAQDEPDLARVVHHAIEAGDDATVVAHAPEAARQACLAGAQSQGAALYEQALLHPELLAAEDRARIAEAYAWALFHSDRRHEALRAAEDAVRLREDLGDDVALGQALACLSVQQWSGLRTGGRARLVRAGRRAARRGGDSAGASPRCSTWP